MTNATPTTMTTSPEARHQMGLFKRAARGVEKLIAAERTRTSKSPGLMNSVRFLEEREGRMLAYDFSAIERAAVATATVDIRRRAVEATEFGSEGRVYKLQLQANPPRGAARHWLTR